MRELLAVMLAAGVAAFMGVGAAPPASVVTVIDAATRVPIAAAIVTVAGAAMLTDEHGRIRLPDGDSSARVRSSWA